MRIAMVLKGYPRLSETFIAQEIHGLERLGADLILVSLRHPTDSARHPVHDRIKAPVLYLPEYLHEEAGRVFGAVLAGLARPGVWPLLGLWARDFLRDPTRNRVRRLGQAFVLAREAGPGIGAFHAQFLHTPGSVARYAARLTGRPWSVSAHAVDIWTLPAWEKREKLRDARFAVTCTRIGRDHLDDHAGPEGPRVHLAYHGLDWTDIPAAPDGDPRRADGSRDADPVRLVTVARAVAKKGLGNVIRALRLLPADIHWHWTLIGGGPLLSDLEDEARAAGLADRIVFAGARPRDAVFAALQASDLFVLASRVTADGNRDGLPNVLMEAMSQRLACLSTEVSAIAELITHGRTGWLVPPNDDEALARAMHTLMTDPALRARLGRAGQAHVRAHFGAETGLATVASLLLGDAART